MIRYIVIAVAVLVALTALGVLGVSYSTRSAEMIISHLEDCMRQVTCGDYASASRAFESAEKEWEKVDILFSATVRHSELHEAALVFGRVRAALDNRFDESALTGCAELIVLINDVVAQETPTISNIL